MNLSPPLSAAVSHEQPLPRSRYLLFLFTATLLILAFYLYVFVAIILSGLLSGLVLIIGILGAQYGGLVLFGSVYSGLWTTTSILARSLRLNFGPDFRIKLERADAPQLWANVEALAQRMGIAPPREIVLERGVNAWVQLSGVAAGRGKTKLGVGFDLLAGLTPAQANAVMAHEMAHAKHVQRGYQGFLMKGLARLNQCVGTLESVQAEESNPKQMRFVSRLLGALPTRIAKIAGKLIAVCSRYDEFEADGVAAELCGSQVCRTALLSTHVLDHQADRISYRDRLLHLERSPGYTAWIRQQLHVSDEMRRAEIEARAIEHARRHELSTHPALPDRLAALAALSFEGEAAFAGGHEGESAIFWLKQPDESAKKLIREIERIAQEQEHKETERLAKGIKERRKKTAKTSNWAYGFIAFILWVAVEGGFLAQQPASVAWAIRLLALAGAIAWGVYYWNKTHGTHETSFVIPYPTFSAYRAAYYRRQEEYKTSLRQEAEEKLLAPAEKAFSEARFIEERSQQRVAIGARLRASLPPELVADTPKNRRARLKFWLQQGTAALRQCDYETALMASRLALEEEQKHSDALLIFAIAGSGCSISGTATSEALNLAYREQNTLVSTQWGVAWVNAIRGGTEVAEAYLLPLITQKETPAIWWALLGYAQVFNGKPREALAARRKGLELAQKSGDSNDEACYRFALAQSQTRLGLLSESREQLDWLSRFRANLSNEQLRSIGLDEEALVMEELRWQLSSGHEESALEIGQRLAQNADAEKLLQLADSFSDSSEPIALTEAVRLYEAALEQGFYPQAYLALAELDWKEINPANRAHNYERARQHILQGLNATRERPEGAAHPLTILNEGLQILRAFEDAPPQKVEAFETILEAASFPLDVQRLGILCFAPNMEAARARINPILEALLPGRDLTPHLSIAPASAELQPDTEAPPGIYGARWQE